MKGRKIKGVIFDLDGLLLDTEPIYWRAAEDICSRYGKHYSDSIVCQVIGKQESIGAKIIIDELKLPLSVEEFLKERDAKVEELFPNALDMLGAKKLSSSLHKKGVPMAIATSSNSVAVRCKLTNHKEWFKTCFGYDEEEYYSNNKTHSTSERNTIRRLVCGTEVRNAKPAPDIYLEAARRISIPPENCLVFEDAPGGITAAKAAGMFAIAVPPKHIKIDPSFYHHADIVIGSLEEFDPHELTEFS